jgi:hypothetical protein
MPSATTYLEWKAQGHAEGLAEGMAVGMAEARRSDLLKVLYMKFPDVPYEVTGGIRGMTELDQLSRWFEAAVVSATLDQFRHMTADADARAASRTGRWA